MKKATLPANPPRPTVSDAYLATIVRTLHLGYRFGSNHQNAKLTEREVELMRQMHEEYEVGHPKHWGYRRLAKKFGVGRTTVRTICNYKGWSRAHG